MLTICIPTYNRNNLLYQCLLRLLPQLRENHQLLLIDNCSNTPIKDSIGGLLDQFNISQDCIVRNSVNIGGAGNILRCLELCETQWMYCLGDDDLVSPGCIESIEKVIATHVDAIYISFNRAHSLRLTEVRTEGMRAFIDQLYDWSSFLFMSAVVVNAERMRAHIRWGNLYSYSWAPLQAILIKMLNSGGAVIFSEAIICSKESLAEGSWVPFPVAAGKMILPELVEDKALQSKLARRLMAQPTLTSLIYWARASSVDSAVLARNSLFVKLYLERCEYYVGTLRLWPFKLGAFVLLNPRLLPNWLFRLVENIIHKVLDRPVPGQREMSDSRT